MKTSTKIFLGVIGAVLVVIGLVAFLGRSSATANLGGTVENYPSWFTNGIRIAKGTGTGYFVGGNTNDTTFGIATTANGATPLFSMTSSGALTTGGSVVATTTTLTASTLLAATLVSPSIISMTPGGASWTLTLPASSTLSTFIPTAGMSRTVTFVNATTTAGKDITLVGGTGTILRSASTTAIIQSNTAGTNAGKVVFIRKSNTDIEALLTLYNN